MVAAGIATGLTALTKQNVGAYTAAGLFITIWASRIFDTERDWRGRVEDERAVHRRHRASRSIPALIWLIAIGRGSVFV